MNFYILNKDKSTGTYIKSINKAIEAGQIGAGRILLRDIDFLTSLLETATDPDLKSTDQLIPSHDAPHILAQVIIGLLKRSGYRVEFADFPSGIGTPYEKDLRRGLKAASFITGTCPAGCIEPPICPVRSSEREWDIGKALKGYAERGGMEFIGFECSQFIDKVATIPIKNIVAGWFNIKGIVSAGKGSNLLIATHSKCHGIAANLTVKKL